jgi:nucleotide-binding universal stress UspA family protein
MAPLPGGDDAPPVNGRLVLVAVDGSPASDTAIDTSLELAGALRSPVRFVHVSTELADRLFLEDIENGPATERIVAEDAVLRDALERARAAGVEATVELVGGDGGTGDIAAIVAGIADGLEAGLVVCGSRGRGSAAGAVLGSVSHNLVRYAHVPVLIVHAPR